MSIISYCVCIFGVYIRQNLCVEKNVSTIFHSLSKYRINSDSNICIFTMHTRKCFEAQIFNQTSRRQFLFSFFFCVHESLWLWWTIDGNRILEFVLGKPSDLSVNALVREREKWEWMYAPLAALDLSTVFANMNLHVDICNAPPSSVIRCHLIAYIIQYRIPANRKLQIIWKASKNEISARSQHLHTTQRLSHANCTQTGTAHKKITH